MIHIEPYNAKHYSLNIRVENNRLTWDCGGDGTLLFRCPFGIYPFHYLRELCIELEHLPLTMGVEMPIIIQGITFYIQYIDYRTFLTSDIFISGSANSYAIVACSIIGDDVTLYEPRSIEEQIRDLPLELNLVWNEEYKTERSGFLGLRESVVSAGYYSSVINIDEDTYENGDLGYTINGIDVCFPITKAMLNKKIFVKTDEKPSFVSYRRGLIISADHTGR